MARKSLGYTELEWTCPYCNGRNAGTAKFCMSCGAGQPDDVEFTQPAQEDLITDEEKIAAIAARGADIHCAYCETRNPGDAKFCQQCGADLAEGVRRESGAVLGAHRDDEAPDIKCPACGSMNPGDARRCSQCGQNLAAPAPDPKPQPRPAAQPKAPAPRRAGVPVFAIIAVAFVGCAAIFLFMTLFRSDEVVGTVQSAEWERTIVIEGLQETTYQTWADQIPDNAVAVGQCESRVQRTQAQPPANATYQEVCGTPYTIDTGSGFGEVVQDCTYEVYGDYCEYSVMEWSPLDTMVLTGAGFNPTWPALGTLSETQREGARSEEYVVVFSIDGDTKRYSPSSFERYSEFQPGSEWMLDLNPLGGIVNIEQR